MATANSNVTVSVIGESVQIRGSVRGSEDLHVRGHLEGSLDLDRTLVVAESGTVKAEVRVHSAVIAGVVEGNVHASESVELTREGRMVGDIEAPRVIIADGASFRGKADTGAKSRLAERRAVTPPPEAQPAPVPGFGPAPAEPAKQTKADETSEKAPEARSTRRAVSLNAPKAKGLPKKSKARVVVKRR